MPWTVDFVLYGSYVNIALGGISIVLLIGVMFIKPKNMRKLKYLDRLKVSLVELPHEKEIFAEQYPKLKLNRTLTRTLVGVLILNCIIATVIYLIAQVPVVMKPCAQINVSSDVGVNRKCGKFDAHSE
ncbi:hypothetical protein DOM22_10890 [Bdellovibrio sp. ZAP7]|uniref:hypothetical protein n=1 Tax=Bdellovibrio sp. ZAP7 TaxID=2231053 RepID=UPI0011648270|nr:hypothetical protein [Bdellovibrio sp. ZAP7]QDK45617.1 hypothetical protein DOM22_10890 [Bdellovibrio sp. ZAP7]